MEDLRCKVVQEMAADVERSKDSKDNLLEDCVVCEKQCMDMRL